MVCADASPGELALEETAQEQRALEEERSTVHTQRILETKRLNKTMTKTDFRFININESVLLSVESVLVVIINTLYSSIKFVTHRPQNA